MEQDQNGLRQIYNESRHLMPQQTNWLSICIKSYRLLANKELHLIYHFNKLLTLVIDMLMKIEALVIFQRKASMLKILETILGSKTWGN